MSRGAVPTIGAAPSLYYFNCELMIVNNHQFAICNKSYLIIIVYIAK